MSLAKVKEIDRIRRKKETTYGVINDVVYLIFMRLINVEKREQWVGEA